MNARESYLGLYHIRFNISFNLNINWRVEKSFGEVKMQINSAVPNVLEGKVGRVEKSMNRI
jgi:hypothetical protein